MKLFQGDHSCSSAAGARRRRLQGCLALFLIGLSAPAIAQDDLSARLHYRLESGSPADSLQVIDERLLARQTLRRMYVETGYRPIWVTAEGPRASATAFIKWLHSGPERHGLRPENYHVRAVESLDDADKPGALIDLELALSDAFLLLASHLLAGQLNPETLDPQWRANRRHRDLVPLTVAAAASDDPSVTLASLLPTAPAYQKLVERLDMLRDLQTEGGWIAVPDGPTLRPGDRHERVALVAARLAASGDHAGGADLFGADLALSVAAFQARHGLEADGIVGKATLAALNVPLQQRIDQLIVNLERWRWLPEDLGSRHILVNIAGFSLDVIDNGAKAMSMRVIVGRPYRRTPVFSDNVRYLVLNPYWEVPRSIAVRDKLPLIKADPGYLAANGYTLLDGWGADERIVEAESIDWQSVDPKTFRYRLRQSPGPANALGRVKFMFPNEYSVYLHDTPSRELFHRDLRSFSSGCIRLEHPLELAEYLLSDSANWSRSSLERALGTGKERVVPLATRMPVHLLYWTAWVDDHDVIQFRDDIYGRDTLVLNKLRTPAPI